MSTVTEPLDAIVEPWQQFTLRDALVLVSGWCAGFAFAAEHRTANLLDHPWRRATDVEWLIEGFLVGGVLAAACLFALQRAAAGRQTRLSLGEGMAFYPLWALAVSTMLLLVLFAVDGFFHDEGRVFGIGAVVLAVLHYGFGVLALVLLFMPPPRHACPWTHRLGCWNAILSVVCFVLHTLQRSWIYIDL